MSEVHFMKESCVGFAKSEHHLSSSCFLQICNRTLASKWEQGSRSLGCSGTIDVPKRWPEISSWNRACFGTKFSSFWHTSPYTLWCRSQHFKIPDASLVICVANVAFGTMVPEHLTSLSYSKQVWAGTHRTWGGGGGMGTPPTPPHDRFGAGGVRPPLA